MRVRRARLEDADGFLGLVRSLAEFERLAPPDKEAERRLVADVFARRRLRLLVAESGGRLVGYALYYFGYSSFLARPTLYLEDIFVAAQERRKGAGEALFRRCAREALKEGCGRMEWTVLTWNSGAIRFYEGKGASRLRDWHMYRLEGRGLRAAAGPRA